MYVVKKEKSKHMVRTTFVITRVTPDERKWLEQKAGGKGNLSYMLRYYLGLENNPGIENYVPPEE